MDNPLSPMPAQDLTLEDRIRRVEARSDIEALSHLYCCAMDDQDSAILEPLFTQDARVFSDNGWMNSAGGRDGVVRMYRDFWATLGATYHWMHGHLITFDDQDRDSATGLVMGHAETWRIPKQATYLIAMRYKDRYRREDGHWRFAERRVSFLYFCDPREYPDILGGALRVTVRGKGEPADWPKR
jgi:hypothetical protein